MQAVQRSFPSLIFAHNPDWATTNILASLMSAGDHFKGPVIVSYSDIMYSVQTVQRVLMESADIVLAIDPNWRDSYHGRLQHPESEAEKVVIQNGLVKDIGKRIAARSAAGEFIGLASFSAKAAETVQSRYRALRGMLEGQPFHEAARFESAYLTDMIKELIVSGTEVRAVAVVGAWAEFDTLEDVMRAQLRVPQKPSI
jgi:choline kinase